MMGNIPMVLNIARQMNQARCPDFAAFHIATNLKIPSHNANIIITGINQGCNDKGQCSILNIIMSYEL